MGNLLTTCLAPIVLIVQFSTERESSFPGRHQDLLGLSVRMWGPCHIPHGAGHIRLL